MSPPSTYEERLVLLRSDKKNIDSAEPDEAACCPVPARYVLALLGFLGFFITLSMRASLSVAVVAMVNSTTSSLEGQSSGEFNWDETTQGIVLGAYYYGYAVTQLCGGWLAAKLGGRNVLGVGFFCSAVLNLLAPLAARADVGYFIVIRALQGVAESVSCPAMNNMWGVWAPPRERGRLVNFTYAAVELGTVLGMLTSGFLSQYGFAGGWPSVFYIHGMLGCVWALLWMLLIHDSPDKHPRLTSKERALFDKMEDSTDVVKIPWRHIATSPAVWAIAANHFMISWSFSSVAALLPTYMSNIQHFAIEQNGILSSLPFLTQWLSEMGTGFLVDMLRSARCLNTQTSSKLLNGIGGLTAAIFFAAMGYVPEGCPAMAVVIITLAMSCSALCVCCVRVSHLDIAPRHAGTLYGLTNGLSSTAGFIAPALVGALTAQGQTVAQWRIYYYITAALFLVCPTIFCLMGKGEELWWAKVSSY